ncbi:MAG: hypothetical protein ACI8ZB_003922 [Desulforhopalus sp.]|jgi:hypothetical protein
MTTQKAAITASLLLLALFPATSFARSNSVDTGISISYDYDDRQYDTISGAATTDRDDDYQTIAISPLIRFISSSRKDRFEIQASPSIKYDLLDSETDWDNDLYLAAERSVNKSWRLIGSNSLIRNDYHDSLLSSDTDNSVSSSPELSDNYGRTRYWQNTLNLASEHTYGQESLVNFGFAYTLLRNDESDFQSYDDYDRYVGSVTNEHRFNQDWSTTTDLSVVRGDFETIAPSTLLTESDTVSDDLMEYHFLTTLENQYTRQTTLGLSYNYIGTKYDEDIRVDFDIHQLQLTWSRIFARQTTVTLGAGPSYEKSEGRDSNVGGNGIAEIEYQAQHGSVTFGVEKSYGVDNFSGTEERGFIDYWDTHLLFDYQIMSNLTLDGQIRYRYEDREQFTDDALGLSETDLVNNFEEYNTEEFVTGLGLSYNFLQNYTASMQYTFTKQESEIVGDNYDDHRFLFTLSWEQNWLRW